MLMRDFLCDYVAAHQDHPSKTPNAFETADKAWRAAGGKTILNRRMFMGAYRSCHVAPSGQIVVGPIKRGSIGKIIEAGNGETKPRPVRRDIGRISTSGKG
jgi:hypothetical protein